MMMNYFIGQTASFSKTLSEFDVYGFAGITGDFNDVHINSEKSRKSQFGERIAHGMLVGSFISTVLGTKFPGKGTIYLEQQLIFKKPVYIGDTITAIVSLSEIIDNEKGIIKLDTRVENQNGDIAIDGYAVVMKK